MPLIEFYASVIAGLGNVFLGLFTFFKNPQSRTNQLFFLFTMAISSYLLVNYLAINQITNEATLFWVRLIMLIAVFVNLLFFLFVDAFPSKNLNIRPLWLVLAALFTGILLPITQTDLIFQDVRVMANNRESIPGIGMPLFLLHTIVFLGGGFLVLINKFLHSNGVEKAQVKMLLLGTIFMFVSIIITNLIFVLVFNITLFINLLPLYTLIFVGFVSYAIVRHKFLDINFVVARAVVFAILILLVGIAYAIGFFILGTYFFNLTASTNQLVISTVIALAIAFSFQPIWHVVEKITDKFLYKNHYDTKHVLYDAALTMASILRLDDLCKSLLELLLSKIKIYDGFFLLTNQGKLFQFISHGYETPPIFVEQDLSVLQSQNSIVVFEEVLEGPLKDLMRKDEISILVPLKTGGQVLGLMGLGQKLSGDPYSSEDLKLIEILAPEIAVALENAKSFEEIRKFNITLQQEIQKATQDLQNANNRLKELDHLKDDFVSVASHELRTPMTAIRSYVWMALHKPDMPLTEKLKRYLYRTLISTERLITLVNDMLNVSRIEAGKIEIYPKPFDVIALVKDVLEEVKAKADEKLIKLQVMEQKLPLVFADPDKVHQILLNLIGNALKFTPPDGIISVGFFTDGNMVEVSVKDTGAGISKEDLSKLFHKFSRLDNSYVAMGVSGGTGLGLYISKSLVDLMHGKIWATSEGENKGATFTFSLPIATQELIKEAEKFHIKPKGEVKVLEPVTIE